MYELIYIILFEVKIIKIETKLF